MTTSLRILALSSCCVLFAACSGEHQHELPTRPSVPRTPEPTSEPLAATALTATAPTRPQTLLDEPSLGAHEALGDESDKKKPRADATEPTGIVLGHDGEPEATESFDRPLRADEVKLTRFVLATGVERREPTGVSDAFDQDTPQIFAFMELANESAPYALEVHFEKLGGPRSQYGVELHVGTAARFRTWAWTKIRREPGEYRAVLRTLGGEEIASHDFVITEPAHD